jgi:hypothetical protein
VGTLIDKRFGEVGEGVVTDVVVRETKRDRISPESGAPVRAACSPSFAGARDSK